MLSTTILLLLLLVSLLPLHHVSKSEQRLVCIYRSLYKGLWHSQPCWYNPTAVHVSLLSFVAGVTTPSHVKVVPSQQHCNAIYGRHCSRWWGARERKEKKMKWKSCEVETQVIMKHRWALIKSTMLTRQYHLFRICVYHTEREEFSTIASTLHRI